jgi:hypothetical protein
MKEEWEKLESDLLHFCSEFLYKQANFEDFKDLYWIGGGFSDGEYYCCDCCNEQVDKINKQLEAKGEDPDAFVDGGWGGMEEDGCAFCEVCNDRLEVSLTQYGVESEVDHFLSCDLIDQEELSNNQIIDLYNIFEYSTYYDFSNECKRGILRLAHIVSCCSGKTMGFIDRFELLDL